MALKRPGVQIPQRPLCFLLLRDVAALPRPLLARQATMCQGMLRFVIGLEKSLNIIQSLIPMYFNLDSNVLFEQIFLEA